MDDQLLHYYERELTYIRAMAAEFARTYPKIAGRLLLEPDRCEDPHTERLIEAFAFVSGRIHKKIDDDFPQITESLFNILYPHYINPIPSMTVVKFEPVRQNVPENGYRIDSRTKLYSKPVQGAPCQFFTTQPVMLWPVEVVSAGLRDPLDVTSGAPQAIFIELKTLNKLKFSQLGCEFLRFFLNGPSQHVFHLYELLLNNVSEIIYESMDSRGKGQTVATGPDNIKPVGFEPNERMLPYPQRSFPGYSLLFEYFCFPEKFLFFDLGGLQKIRQLAATDTLRIWINLNRSAKTNLVVDHDTFLLNASPAVNLFKRLAEPIRVEQRKTEYQVVADVRRPYATEVFSVDQVKATSIGSPGKEIQYKPFYSIRHHLEKEDTREHRAF